MDNRIIITKGTEEQESTTDKPLAVHGKPAEPTSTSGS
jgi:hypothetical protein